MQITPARITPMGGERMNLHTNSLHYTERGSRIFPVPGFFLTNGALMWQRQVQPPLRNGTVTDSLGRQADPYQKTRCRVFGRQTPPIGRRTGLKSWTTLPGIYVSDLGAPDGGVPGGIFLLDHFDFNVLGRWEVDRGPQELAYDFW